MEKLISETYVKKEAMSGSTFAMLKFVVASICYNYSYLETNLFLTHCIRSNPLFVALGSNHIWNNAFCRFSWTSTVNTPVFTGIPLML